ncbi:MAG: dTDP-glucose 4,6-dehydratase [Planctomycetaceae bacterium]|nr:dTDP-glucose 4,6-dehydratase [Planctomycetales bacterium]MCB9875323.1 dTDP-glucose 4,6-dehydratase [Planctomycetaceae bacterium]MCB9937256.1 dTDP-glucose 4,6-dehydratase [Planctomycetaceae bacterium]
MHAILVTGGAGFIGSCFVRQWIREETDTVVVLDKLTYAGNLQSLASVANDPRFVFRKGDIADSELVRSILSDYEVRAIVHFAAESHVDRSIDGPAAFVETNVVGTFRLLEAACRYWQEGSSAVRDRFRFLHVSTDEVYGSLGADGKFSETTAYAPNSPYAASKAASDHFVRAYHATFGLPMLLTNCSNNYGPYQFPEKLIPLTILNAVEGKPLPIYGDGENIRDWLHVEDHCRAIRMVLKQAAPGEVFNIGGECERSNLQVVKAICDAVDRLRPESLYRPTAELIQFVEDRPGHDRRYSIDSTKIQSEIGWSPTVAFEKGLEETVRWYLANDEWVRHVRSGVYRRTRLGLA